MSDRSAKQSPPEESTEKRMQSPWMDRVVDYGFRAIIFATFLLLLVMILREVGGPSAVEPARDVVWLAAALTVAYGFYPYWSRALLLAEDWMLRWWSSRD